MIDLNPHHLKTVKRILAEHLPDCEVRAFGSRATWTAWEYSDLDLAVVSPEPLDRRTSANLREAFEESDLPIRVDVVDWATLTDGFRQVIEGDCVVVQEAVRSSEWREYTIGEIADVVGGATPSTKNPHNFNGDIPWLTPKDLSGLHDRSVDRGARNLSQQGLDSSSARLLPPGSVLLSTRAPIGYVALAKNAISTNQGFRSLVMRDGFSAEYMYYWLLTNTEELERHASGSTFRELSGSSLKTIRLKLPPLDEQRRIVGILGALDDKIELNRRMSQTLEAMAQALFKSWFVDFDPVRAKAEGRPTGLPPRLDALFPDSFQESELGKIPSGWEVGSLGDVIELAYGKALRAKDRRHGSVPVYGSNGQVGWHDRKLIAGPGIVVGRKGNPGVVKWSAADFFPIDTTFYVVPHGHITSLLFLFFALHWQGLPSIAADSAVPGLNRNLAYMNRQLVPPSQLVSQFDERVRALFGRCRSLNDESAQLACQTDALLPELMCGRVTAAPTNASTQT